VEIRRDAAWLSSLRDHWRDRYDWRSAEAAFNAHPQFTCEIDGVLIHFPTSAPRAAAIR